MTLTPGPCPECGGPPPPPVPRLTTRRCGPERIGVIVAGRTVTHLGGGEAGVAGAELDARARDENPAYGKRRAA